MWTRALAYRERAELPYDGGGRLADAPLMLDTTVYIDAQKTARLPGALVAAIAAAPLLHSAVALSELAAGLGLLDPAHPATPKARAAIEGVLARIAPERIVEPSAAAWIEAAVVSGILARTQGLPRVERRKLLNDALMFISAGETGAVLVSRNRADFDLLLRFRPEFRLWLYDIPQTSP